MGVQWVEAVCPLQASPPELDDREWKDDSKSLCAMTQVRLQ